MSFDRENRTEILRERAAAYIEVATANIEREYPHMPWLVVTSPGLLPVHRELHPAFFGSFDWHSCVEMYWVAVRLLRLVPDADPGNRARLVIGNLLTEANIATECAFFANPDRRNFERPYGWGWLLTLQHELDRWDDPDGEQWARILRPLATALSERFVEWLPLLTYPQRTGVHPNTAFALLRSLGHAGRLAATGQPELRDAIEGAARRFFANDTDYPARYEPSGADFLSAALSEAELMGQLLPADAFARWLDAFLPGLASGEPRQLFEPAGVSDMTDGQIAHLAGLNLSRASSFLRIAGALPDGDPRPPVLEAAAERHAHASLPVVTGCHYMAEHWLAAYATLLLTA